MSALTASALGLLLGLAATTGDAYASSGEVVRARQVRRAWRSYAKRFIQSDGRVIDWSDGGVTTSEGQAYALVRAVWADDQRTFDRVLRWTRDNLQAGDPATLPAWRWGEQDGAWGVIDDNPAADADQWMAYALLLAADRWDDARYRGQARALLVAIWAEEVGDVAGFPVMLPGPWAVGQDPVRLNPSYFLPFAYRAFAVADPGRPWMRLVDSSYAVLTGLMGEGADAVLPPDWVWVDAARGERVPTPADAPAGADDHGWEAFRVAWTLAADAVWYDEHRARVLLLPYAALGQRWRRDGSVAARVAVDGSPLEAYASPGQYGALLAAWSTVRAEDVADLFAREIAPLRGKGGWGGPDDYYGQNWTWLGAAFVAGMAAPPEALR
jgi:endo-1,4-beta-D-glucanase Y